MADPTNQTTPPIDYSARSKAELLDLLIARDRSLRDLAMRAEKAEAEAEMMHKNNMAKLEADVARDKERDAKRAARGVAKLLGKIDVFDIDEPEDVIARAMAVRAGHVPVTMAKHFRTDARMRAAPGTVLAERLSKRKEASADVPIGTTFARGELPDEDINDLYAAGAIIAVG
jgi:hypothetical protein